MDEVIVVPDKKLDEAIVMQEKFIKRYYEKYQMNPDFDVLILAIMNELKHRKQIEKVKKSGQKIASYSD